MKKVLKRVFIALGIIVLLLLAVGAVAFFTCETGLWGRQLKSRIPTAQPW